MDIDIGMNWKSEWVTASFALSSICAPDVCSISFLCWIFFLVFPLWHCIALHCIQRSNHLSIQVFVVSWITRLCALCTNTEQNYLWNKKKIMTNRRLFNKIDIEIANVCVWVCAHKVFTRHLYLFWNFRRRTYRIRFEFLSIIGQVDREK